MGHEYSSDKDVVEFSNEEWPVSKKRKLMLRHLATWTRSATKPGGGGTATFILDDNPMYSIIRGLEGVLSRIAEYELEMQHVEELVGNPPQESLIAAILEAIQDPRRLQELKCKVNHFIAENRKTTEEVRKLEEE